MRSLASVKNQLERMQALVQQQTSSPTTDEAASRGKVAVEPVPSAWHAAQRVSAERDTARAAPTKTHPGVTTKGAIRKTKRPLKLPAQKPKQSALKRL